jgi:predicted enzyme related to lactoylglutathione lyase
MPDQCGRGFVPALIGEAGVTAKIGEEKGANFRLIGLLGCFFDVPGSGHERGPLLWLGSGFRIRSAPKNINVLPTGHILGFLRCYLECEEVQMNRVKGIGGIFFKAENVQELGDWYTRHLGIQLEEQSYSMFPWLDRDNPERETHTVWALFPRDTEYFSPGNASFMINYQVEDLHALLAQLKSEGVQVDDKIEEHEYGKFGWIVDPEGNRIELWEPPAGH